MPETMKIRASSMPLAVLCPASAANAVDGNALDVDESDGAADLGTRVHDAIERFITDGIEHPNVALPDAVEDDFWLCFNTGKKAWRNKYADAMPAAHAEAQHEQVHPDDERIYVTGKADVIDASRTTAIVVDWKTGRKKTDHFWQLLAYAWLTHKKYGVDGAVVHVCWLRSGNFESKQFGPSDFEKFEAELVRIYDNQTTYRPGEHCDRCRHRHTCPAKRQITLGTAASIVEGDLSAITSRWFETGVAEEPAGILDVYEKLKLVSTASTKMLDQFKKAIAKHGDLGDGERTLTSTTTESKSIEFGPAEDTLLAHDLLDNAADFLTVKKTELMKVVGMNAKDRGDKVGEAKAALMAELEEAGAVKTSTRVSLTIERSKADDE